jgi:hypothetical protein
MSIRVLVEGGRNGGAVDPGTIRHLSYDERAVRRGY